MGVDINALSDLIATTLRDLPKGEFEAMWDFQNYAFCKILQESKREVDGGTTIQRNAVMDEDGSARFRQLYDTDQPSVSQNQFIINVPFTQVSCNYSWDVIELLANKNSDVGFINLLKSRRVRSMWSLANLIERSGWTTPSSQTDSLHPYGVPYYLNFLANGGTGYGFKANTIRFQNGTTSSVCAGIDAVANPKWANFAGTYQKIDNNLLRLLRTAVRQTRFQPAAFMEAPGNDKVGSSIGLYTSNDVCTELENLADTRDDNTAPKDLAGKMLHSFDGVVYFNKMPVMYVPPLDLQTVVNTAGTTVNPNSIYCVDWTKMQPIVREGYWMVEGKPIIDRGQHTTFTVFNDSSFNSIAINRRSLGFVLHNPL